MNRNYINFLADRKILLCDGGTPKDRRVDTAPMYMAQENIFKAEDPGIIYTMLRENNISCILISSRNEKISTMSASFSDLFYKNEKITILKVKKI